MVFAVSDDDDRFFVIVLIKRIGGQFDCLGNGSALCRNNVGIDG
jgi:hypothetical protein